MSTPVPGMITLSSLNRLADLRHGFFTREGGYSEGVYAALNCGLASGDDRDRVQANRDLVLAQFDLAPERLASVQQVHGNQVLLVDGDWPAADAATADALVTRRRGVALGVLGADCAPVLLADQQASVIAAAHAGWRGALGGILDNTVARMQALGAAPERLVAAIGPCIAQSSYEVGPDFAAPFLDEDPASVIFFAPAERAGHQRFDLPGYIARRLARLGVATITRTPCDTFRQADRFFSHRRAQLQGDGACGRQLSVILLPD